MRGLMGKTCLITGSGRGIGRAIAERLYSEGAHVVICDRSAERAEESRRRIAETVTPATPEAGLLAVGCDVTNPAEIERMFAEAREKLGPVTLLVNNVGGSREKRPFDQQTADGLLASCSLNLVSTVLVTQAFLRQLPETGGAVVNISSSAAVRPKAGRIQYTAGKAAVSAITQSMALELAPRGVRVNAVCPGPTLTEEIQARFNDPVQRPAEEARLAKIPLRRLADVSDIAAAVAFLLSDDAAYITGVLLPVDGGYTVAT